MKLQPPPHRATTGHLQAAYPFLTDLGIGYDGPYLGRDLLGGGPFCFDPWALYRAGVLTNPNVIVVGQIGRGKSTFVKTYLWRQLAFGRNSWVLDPKGEYGVLAEAVGVTPLTIKPGGGIRLNPVDVPSRPDSWDELLDMSRQRADMVCSLTESSLKRSLSPAERTAADLAVRSAVAGCEHPTLGDVVAVLLDPPADLAATVRCDRATLAHDGRSVALELRRLVEGDLAGMFDGPTSAPIDLSAPLVVLDLSDVYASAALPLVITCATAWMRSLLTGSARARRILVIDEAWAVLHDVAAGRWLQATFKLSRSLGMSNVAVVHRVSDLRAAGDDGSVQQRISEGLLPDAEVRVIFGQPPSEAARTAELLALSATERDAVAHLARGVALWKVGQRSFLVEHTVGGSEVALVDTDTAMRQA